MCAQGVRHVVFLGFGRKSGPCRSECDVRVHCICRACFICICSVRPCRKLPAVLRRGCRRKRDLRSFFHFGRSRELRILRSMCAECIGHGVFGRFRHNFIPCCRERHVPLNRITVTHGIGIGSVRPCRKLPALLRRRRRRKRDFRALRILCAFRRCRIVCCMLAKRITHRVSRAARSKREHDSARQNCRQKCAHHFGLTHTFLLVFITLLPPFGRYYVIINIITFSAFVVNPHQKIIQYNI